jgi:hypothetical protein
MGRQVIGTTDDGHIRDRETGHLFSMIFAANSSTAQTYIFQLTEVDTLSIHLVQSAAITASILLEGSCSYMPHPQFPQDETQAIRAGNWAAIAALFKGFPDSTPLLPPGSGNSQLIVLAPTDAILQVPFVRLTVTPNGASGAATVDGYASGKSLGD